jgi:hypothetical protein
MYNFEEKDHNALMSLRDCFIDLIVFLLESVGFSIYDILSANSDDLTSSSPIFMFSVYFSYLIALARTFRIVLNRWGENGCPYLVPDLRRKAFNFSPGM